MNDIEILIAAKGLIEEFGWIQGSFGNCENGFCAMGALDEACRRAGVYGRCTPEYRTVFDRLYRAMDGQIAVSNDVVYKDKSEVLAAFDRAIGS